MVACCMTVAELGQSRAQNSTASGSLESPAAAAAASTVDVINGKGGRVFFTTLFGGGGISFCYNSSPVAVFGENTDGFRILLLS